MDSKRIIILDDHTLFLKGMMLILKECYSKCDIIAYQSISKLKSDKLNFEKFDLLISDIELPKEDTFGLFKSLKEDFPNLPILVVSMHKKFSVIKKCKALNIEGYLLKDEDEYLNEAIQTIINGETYYSKTVTDFCYRAQNSLNLLSQREEDVLKLFAKGFSNKIIAEKLFLSPETIKTHKKHIRLKLNLNNNQEIFEYCKKNLL